MSLQWSEVEPAEFDNYPTLEKGRAPNELDDVMAALQSGRTVELTLADEKAVRGRRLALGRRAKSRGFPIQMRYSENRIIVRRADGDTGTTEALAQSQPADQPRRGRSRKSAPSA
jgi:hypothetical protein